MFVSVFYSVVFIVVVAVITKAVFGKKVSTH